MVLSTDSHRNYLQARDVSVLLRREGMDQSESARKVRGEGRRRHGKPQLTLDESRGLYTKSVCPRLPERMPRWPCCSPQPWACGPGNRFPTPCGIWTIGGRVLRIGSNEAIGFAPKTTKSRRAIQIPEAIRPLLALRARSKLPSALLFAGEGGGPRGATGWPSRCGGYCRRLVCPSCVHSLRGVAATLSTQAGAAAGRSRSFGARVGRDDPSGLHRARYDRARRARAEWREELGR